MPQTLASNIPDWYTVGWRSVSGIDQPALAEGEEKDRSVLNLFLTEQFYGDWYHNAAIIVFVRIESHLIIVLCHDATSRVLGRICFAFPYSVQFRLGLAVHHPRGMQHVLHHLHGTNSKTVS